MASLSNYLRTHRKRLALSQEEVAFLLGVNGMNKGEKVCRDESFAREPSLQNALAYDVIYGKPVRELFAGQYEQMKRQVMKRAKFLSYQKGREAESKASGNHYQSCSKDKNLTKCTKTNIKTVSHLGRFAFQPRLRPCRHGREQPVD